MRLVPVTGDVARAVVGGEGLDVALDDALATLGLTRVPDWPHEDTPDAFRPLAEHPEHAGPGTFLAVDGDAVIGDVGWFGPPVDGTCEIGYGLAASARGRGLGAAAVAELLTWVREQPGVLRVQASVLPGNTPSLQLLHRLGFEQTGTDGEHLVLTS